MILSLFLPFLLHADPPLEKLKVATGFKVSLYAYPVPSAREMTLGPDGVVFVGSRDGGSVYALVPDASGRKAKEVLSVLKGLTVPNGVATKNGDLYVGQIDQIYVYRGLAANLKAPVKAEKFGPPFPSDTHHGWKFIAFGPDGWLYVPVGAPCNICEVDSAKYANLQRLSPDGSKRELVATGIRNTVGFDWNPENKQLWFSDNGRDLLGDEMPPDEINRLTKTGQNFGFPYCHGGFLSDPEFGAKHKCAEFEPPVFKLPAHVAGLGLRFMRNNSRLPNTMLLAEHGSWNRSQPIGYQVMQVKLENDAVVSVTPFLSGFLQGASAWGRPVDVLELKDGSVLVSDDTAGAVYRVEPTGSY